MITVDKTAFALSESSLQEKRKRDEGKTSRVGSYVEEEKRRARAHGVFSGFD